MSPYVQACVVACSALCGAVHLAAADTYASDFQSGDTTGWSHSNLFTDDIGRQVLGVFEVATVTLTLPSFSAGNYSLAFDFFTINSWDGDGSSYSGPDTFAFQINGTAMIDAAFSNAGRVEQTYSISTPFGGGPFIGGYDSVAANELQITRSTTIGNYTYRPTFEFHHDGGDLVLTFIGRVSQPGASYNGFNDEAWALDHVSIVPAPRVLAFAGLGGMAGLRRRR